MKINVIITAGGTSQRYGVENKLLAPCKSSCVLVEAIKPFLDTEGVSKIIVAIHPSFSDEFLNALEVAHIEDTRIILTNGGLTRTQTVKTDFAQSTTTAISSSCTTARAPTFPKRSSTA